MNPTRRTFLRLLGSSAAAVALAPALPSFPLAPVHGENYHDIVAYMRWSQNMMVLNPRFTAIITNIEP